jgi:predicted nucleic acid-binding protein
MANALRTAERRGRINPATAIRARQLLLALPIAVEPVSLADALADVTEMSFRHDLSSYGAAYLALAARRGLPLATVDMRLREACQRAGIELVQP